MTRLFRRLLLAIVLASFPTVVFSQEEVAPLIVEGPRPSITLFTNWQKIELAYTVRYMKGYKPLLDNMKPGNMSFSPLEPDPEFADRLDVRNERQFGDEFYFDVVYHLRHIGEKKGELEIPGQKFPYILPQAGKEDAELRVENFPTKPFLLNYGTVLTSDADDIKDNIDFGSFSKQALVWKVSGGIVFFAGSLLTLIAVFSRPKLVVPVAGEASGAAGAGAGSSVVNPDAVYKALWDGATSLKLLLDPKDRDRLKTELGAVCNNSRTLLRLYAPNINPGDVCDEMFSAVRKLEFVWERERLVRLVSGLRDFENILYGFDFGVGTQLSASTIAEFGDVIRDLDPRNVAKKQRMYRWKNKLSKPFGHLRFKKWRLPWKS